MTELFDMPDTSSYQRLDGENGGWINTWRHGFTMLEKFLILFGVVSVIIIFGLSIALGKCNKDHGEVTTTIAPTTSTTTTAKPTPANTTTTAIPTTTTPNPTTTTAKPTTTTPKPTTTTAIPTTTTPIPTTTTPIPTTTTTTPKPKPTNGTHPANEETKNNQAGVKLLAMNKNNQNITSDNSTEIAIDLQTSKDISNK